MHSFKKSFGQNFLKGHKFQSLMVEYLDLKEDDLVIEIGPGDGSLTLHLLETNALVNSIEIDYSLLPTLLRKFDRNNNFNLINEDILKLDFKELLNNTFNKDRFSELLKDNRGVKICGSLPYNISKRIISSLLDLNLSFHIDNKYGIKIESMCFIVQDEVAKEYVSRPPQAAKLSVISSLYSDIKKGLSIPKDYFYPKPKVDGGILIFKPLNNSDDFNVLNIKEIIKLVNIGYISPRKTLYNNLKSSNKWDSDNILKSIEAIGFINTTRASELSRDNWIKLYSLLINS